MRHSGPETASACTCGTSWKAGQKATCRLPVRWPAASPRRNQPESSWPPSAEVRSVSCCKMSADGSMGAGSSIGSPSPCAAALGGVIARSRLAKRRAGSTPRHVQSSSPTIMVQKPSRAAALLPRSDNDAAMTSIAREISMPPTGNRSLVAGAWAMPARPISAPPTTSKRRGPSGVSRRRPIAAGRGKRPRDQQRRHG